MAPKVDAGSSNISVLFVDDVHVVFNYITVIDIDDGWWLLHIDWYRWIMIWYDTNYVNALVDHDVDHWPTSL